MHYTPTGSLIPEPQNDDDNDDVQPLQPWIINNDTSIHYLLHCDTDHGTLVTMMSTCRLQHAGVWFPQLHVLKDAIGVTIVHTTTSCSIELWHEIYIITVDAE